MEHDLHLLMEEVLEFIMDTQRKEHWPRQIGGSKTTKMSIATWRINGVQIIRIRHSLRIGPGRKKGPYKDEWRWVTTDDPCDRLYVEFDHETSNITKVLLTLEREVYVVTFDVSRNTTTGECLSGDTYVPAQLDVHKARQALRPILG